MKEKGNGHGEAQDDRRRVPHWYTEIFPAGSNDGFYHKMGYHAASFVDRGKHLLVISFDNLSDAGFPFYDIEPWAGKFVAENGWSHLGIYSRGPSWYRDARLIAFLEGLRDDGFFAQFKEVVLIGTSMGAFAALTFSDLAPGARVLALSPQTTLDLTKVDWEVRFQKAQQFDWTLPYSDAAQQISRASKVYVVYDPFLIPDRRQVERMQGENIVHLKAFGMGHKTAVVLRRMEILKAVVGGAIQGTLTPEEYYPLIRNRKDLFLWRRNMEDHLDQRKKARLKPMLSSAFKQRRMRKESAAAAVQRPDDDPEPASQSLDEIEAAASDWTPGPQASVPDAPPLRPRTHANVWMVQQRGPALQYLSDRYHGQVLGYEERDGIALAQTGGTAIGILAYGSVPATPRPHAEVFEPMVVDETLEGRGVAAGAKAAGIVTELLKRDAGRGYKTILAVSELGAGVAEAEVLPGMARYTALLGRLRAGCAAVVPWGKQVFVDRILLRFLTGAPQTPADRAEAHYVAMARALRQDVARITGQLSFPAMVISQSCGSRTDGASPVILTEGRLDLDNPTCGFIVATPTYPFALAEGMPTTLAPDAQMLVDELEARAVAACQRGLEWRCPSLRFASLETRLITAEFTTISDLVLGDGPHGFALEGCTNAARIMAVEAEGNFVRITMSKMPRGEDLALTYAWGARPKVADGFPANRGSLRDSWQEASVCRPQETLFRHALSGRVAIRGRSS